MGLLDLGAQYNLDMDMLFNCCIWMLALLTVDVKAAYRRPRVLNEPTKDAIRTVSSTRAVPHREFLILESCILLRNCDACVSFARSFLPIAYVVVVVGALLVIKKSPSWKGQVSIPLSVRPISNKTVSFTLSGSYCKYHVKRLTATTALLSELRECFGRLLTP